MQFQLRLVARFTEVIYSSIRNSYGPHVFQVVKTQIKLVPFARP